jgi:hypothetical protein
MRLARLLILSLSALLLLAFVTVPPAQADSPVKTLYSLSLLGEPKYPADFKHFDYADADAPKGGMLKRAAIGSFDNFNPFIVKGRRRRAPPSSSIRFSPSRTKPMPTTACSPSRSGSDDHSCRLQSPARSALPGRHAGDRGGCGLHFTMLRPGRSAIRPLLWRCTKASRRP